ncbi:hypothetical protein BV25DRAFT_1048247 [Artomyces pyxidatus]|uniref:Uncharacterized protein n=1 Tax=Artomyces pyxidatus TaxID=48021 RepID=A0ACB8SVB4_9AGAM|nr:hypothetical protein BV25DRAFT_1048247 [Artomyces pyxidatus]
MMEEFCEPLGHPGSDQSRSKTLLPCSSGSTDSDSRAIDRVDYPDSRSHAFSPRGASIAFPNGCSHRDVSLEHVRRAINSSCVNRWLNRCADASNLMRMPSMSLRSGVLARMSWRILFPVH